ncbi:MAG: hypothetical protein Kow0029_01380 [Candidatus Rifleibacteriota bacterium]
MRFSIKLSLAIFALTLFAHLTHASLIQVPDWYKLEIALDSPPEINKELNAKVTLSALIGNLENVKLRLILPENWLVDQEEKIIAGINENSTGTVEFKITPKSFLNQGSIIVEAQIPVPFSALEERLKKDFPHDCQGMMNSITKWPKVSKSYSEVSLALFEEESFYPIDAAMWLAYYQPLAPAKGFKGPVFYDDPVLTTYQAQTDVEMYEKLINYMKADPGLEKKLKESGIDINKKKIDQLNGLYVLAARAFLDNNLQEAINFLDRLESESQGIDNSYSENLQIAACNLRAIIFWQQNQKRLAEDLFKKAFYKNRKNLLQRYTLRNLALLMLSKKETATAAHMMRLAVEIKPGYTQLEREYEKVKSQ